jgi:hypothetical protein
MQGQDSPFSASPSTTPKAARLRETRREIRRAASALIDVSEHLRGQDLALAVRLTEVFDCLLVRLTQAERRSA